MMLIPADVESATGGRMPVEIASDEAVTGYLRERMQEMLLLRDAKGERVWTRMAIADAMDVDRSTVTLFLQKKNDAGKKLRTGMMKLLDITPAALNEAALEWGKQNADYRIERPERYPNRAYAAEMAARSGVSAEAIRTVRRLQLFSRDDPTPDEWLAMMKSEDLKIRYGAKAAPPTGENGH